MGIRSSKLCKMVRSPSLKLLGKGSSDLLTPKGYVPISVGVSKEDSKRFVVHTTTLGDEDFLEFLCRSAEEYDFCNEGILQIPYEASAFEDWVIKDAKHKMLRVTIEEEYTLLVKSNGKRKREESEEEGCKYLKLERKSVQNQMRKFRLRKNCNSSAITVKCENGVLTVVVEKLPPPPKSKTVEVC